MDTLTKRFPLPATEFTFAGFAWPRRVATLPAGGFAKRLYDAKNRQVGPYYHAPKPRTRADDGFIFYLTDDAWRSMRLRYAHDVDGARVNHTGWHTTADGAGEKVCGIVVRLPHCRGFLTGWTLGQGMASALDYTVHDDEVDAARAADDAAQSVAEAECEREERYLRWQELQEQRQQLADELAEAEACVRYHHAGELDHTGTQTEHEELRRVAAELAAFDADNSDELAALEQEFN